MRRAPCVVGVAEHAGWANLVSVAASGGVPALIERRRITLIDPGLPTQPYHHESIGLKEDVANALIARVRRSIAARATDAMYRVVTELAPAHTVVALAIRQPPFPDLPTTIAPVWQSYRLLCAADGMMYQLALCHAARQLGLNVHAWPRGEEASWSAGRLGVTTGDIEAFVGRTGRPSGPPWTQELRRAYAAAIAVLAGHEPLRIRLP